MPSSPVSIDNLITKLQHFKQTRIHKKMPMPMPKALKDRMNDVAANAIEKMTQAAAEFLQNDLDDEKHTEEEIQMVIDAFPEALSRENSYGHLPIDIAAIHCASFPFVPLLAKEGERLGVRGEGSRGGLLQGTDDNLISHLAINNFQDGDDADPTVNYDRKCREMFEKMREWNLLTKGDIPIFHLLFDTFNDHSPQRFAMVTDWDPVSLRVAMAIGDDSLIHNLHTKKTFEMLLKAGMKHFPERLGLLFRKCGRKTACEVAFDKLGVEEVMPIICQYIPPGGNHSIIHIAAEVAPHLEDELMRYYPNEAFTRDSFGRTLPLVKFHAALRNGSKTFKKAASFFANATDDKIEAKDPRSGIYPFMMAASRNKSDLDAVNYLLRRCPQVLVNARERAEENTEDHQSGSLKRQREE
jgi:hypothetical protein